MAERGSVGCMPCGSNQLVGVQVSFVGARTGLPRENDRATEGLCHTSCSQLFL